MFEATSRYFEIEEATISLGQAPENRLVRYKRRRFIPPAEASPTLAIHTYVKGERLDNITASYLGDPTLFWQVCDGNVVLHPDELTEEVGRAFRVAIKAF